MGNAPKVRSRSRNKTENREQKNVKTPESGLFWHGRRGALFSEGFQGTRWLSDNEKDMEAKKAKLDQMLNDDSLPDELPQVVSLGKGVSEADAACFLEAKAAPAEAREKEKEEAGEKEEEKLEEKNARE